MQRYLFAPGQNYRWCFTVQVVCKDGTTIQCQNFQAVDSGVLLYQSTPEREEEDEEMDIEDRDATGFVPITELKFVLPDDVLQRQRAQQERGRAPQVPPGAPPQQTGQVAQQQQLHQSPGPQGHQSPGPGGQ